MQQIFLKIVEGLAGPPHRLADEHAFSYATGRQVHCKRRPSRSVRYLQDIPTRYLQKVVSRDFVNDWKGFHVSHVHLRGTQNSLDYPCPHLTDMDLRNFLERRASGFEDIARRCNHLLGFIAHPSVDQPAMMSSWGLSREEDEDIGSESLLLAAS